MPALKVSSANKIVAPTARAHNALVDYVQDIQGGPGIKVDAADGALMISLDGGTEGASGTGLPDGYTFEEFTICVSGAPATRWWPTWTSNPS